MGAYRPLFNISVEHTFFVDGFATCLDFVPSEQTGRIINNAGLIVKKRVSGIGVVYDQERIEALLAYAEDETDPLCFEFKVYANDPQFKSYTEPFTGKSDGSLLYFDNMTDVHIANEQIRLHTLDFVSNINSENLGSSKVKDILSQKDRLIPPLFVVKIYATGKEGALFSAQFETAARNYYLSFKTRQTFWKYYLLGGMARKNAYIFDLDGGVEFEFAGETPLSDTRSALIFRSKAAIPLRQKQNFRFQLKEKGAGGDRVLIKRLPVASTGQFGKEVVSEQGIVVSEIYVNC
jgi:hypothetical protein